jgi:hypothetical protein
MSNCTFGCTLGASGGGTVPAAAARFASGGIVEPRGAGAVDMRTDGGGGGTIDGDDARFAAAGSGGVIACDDVVARGCGGTIASDDVVARGCGGTIASDDVVARGCCGVIASDDVVARGCGGVIAGDDARGGRMAGDDASGGRIECGSGNVGRGCSRVACGARERGSGATSAAAPRGGIVEVIRAGCDAGGALNRSAPGSLCGIGFLFCTRSISSLTAVDSVFPMRARALRMRFGRSSENTL